MILEKLQQLNAILLKEMSQYQNEGLCFEKTISAQRRLLRSLMNVRPPMPIDDDFIALQDEVLQSEVTEKGVIMPGTLTPLRAYPHVYIWQGDITRLNVDAIVNAANSALLGCFIPCHGCIDNAIHSVAGLQLRRDCEEIINNQGHKEATGQAKITKGYNLPSKFVIHTVGPIIQDALTTCDCEMLASAYKNCLQLAIDKNLKSIAFCCISTGEFRFPNEKAAQIAVDTVLRVRKETNSDIEVIFNVFKEIDYKIYRSLLGEDQ